MSAAVINPSVRSMRFVPAAAGDISLPAGKTSKTNIAWSVDRDGPYIPTPLLYRGILYSLNNNGVLTPSTRLQANVFTVAA